MQGIDRKISVGVLWNLVSLFLSRGANTIFILLLAKFLTPEAFGLVAMATIMFEIAQAFVSSGLGAALIQSRTVSDLDLNTVFYTNLLLSVLAYVAIYFSAPYLAAFYGQPDLVILVRVMGVVVFINAVRVVQIAILSRNMDFKTQMKAQAIGVLVSGLVAIFAASKGLGVWSLVFQMLGSALVSALLLWLLSTWRPALMFSKTSFLRLFKFGRNLLIEGVLTAIFQNSYLLVIGRLFSAEVTGLYFFARKISNLISQQLTGAVQQASFPAISPLQDQNEELLFKYRNIMKMMAFLISPIMGLLAGLAPTLFELMFDPQWRGAVPYLQLLCLAGALYPVHALNVNLLMVKGRSDLVVKVGLVKKTISVVFLVAAIPYGVIGIVVGQVVASILALGPSTYFAKRLIGYTFGDQILDVAKALCLGLVAGCCGWACSFFNLPSVVFSFFLSLSAGVLTYAILAILFDVYGARITLRYVRAGVAKIIAGSTYRPDQGGLQ
jgi:lipopolysaccharide exporter